MKTTTDAEGRIETIDGISVEAYQDSLETVCRNDLIVLDGKLWGVDDMEDDGYELLVHLIDEDGDREIVSLPVDMRLPVIHQEVTA